MEHPDTFFNTPICVSLASPPNTVDAALYGYLQRWGAPYAVGIGRAMAYPVYSYTIKLDITTLTQIQLSPDRTTGVGSSLALFPSSYRTAYGWLIKRMPSERAEEIGNDLFALVATFTQWFVEHGTPSPARDTHNVPRGQRSAALPPPPARDTHNLDLQFAEYYRVRRRGKGYTLDEIARRSGYSPGYVRQRKMEYDRRTGRTEHRRKQHEHDA